MKRTYYLLFILAVLPQLKALTGNCFCGLVFQDGTTRQSILDIMLYKGDDIPCDYNESSGCQNWCEDLAKMITIGRKLAGNDNKIKVIDEMACILLRKDLNKGLFTHFVRLCGKDFKTPEPRVLCCKENSSKDC